MKFLKISFHSDQIRICMNFLFDVTISKLKRFYCFLISFWLATDSFDSKYHFTDDRLSDIESF